LCDFAVWCVVKQRCSSRTAGRGYSRATGSLGNSLQSLLPFPPLLVPMQASEVLNLPENKGSLLISKAATCVVGRGVLLGKQRHLLGTGEEDVRSWGWGRRGETGPPRAGQRARAVWN